MIDLLSRRVWTGLVVIGFLLSGGAIARAQEFSADLVVVKPGSDTPAPAGWVSIAGHKMRLETPDLANGFFLVDEERPAAWFVRPAARMFMEARQSSPLTRMFVPVDPVDPCKQWQAMAAVAGMAGQGDWRCERGGDEKIGARDTTRYLVVSGAGQQFSGWVDAAHKFPIRIALPDGTVFTAENIRDEPQSADLFDMPVGLARFDPRELIERVKQSDVWVDGQPDASHAAPDSVRPRVGR